MRRKLKSFNLKHTEFRDGWGELVASEIGRNGG
jgi:hypothetical protein